MAAAVTFPRGVDELFFVVLLLLGPLLLHAASGIASSTAAAAILLDLRMIYSDSMTRRDDHSQDVTNVLAAYGIYDT
jgi:hypothetical protein